jgi:hypothetical protein
VSSVLHVYYALCDDVFFLIVEKPGGRRFDEQIAVLDNSPDYPSLLIFHPFEPYVAIADDSNGSKIIVGSTE